MPTTRKQAGRKTARKRSAKNVAKKAAARPAKKIAKKAPGRSAKAMVETRSAKRLKTKHNVLKVHGPQVYVFKGGEVRATHSHGAVAGTARAVAAKVGVDEAQYSAIRKKVLAGVSTSLFKGRKA